MFFFHCQVCIDPLRLYESNKLEYKELKVLVTDNFVSMVGANKFELGELSDYMIVEENSHLSHGNFWDVITNPVKSASIYLPFNPDVAALIIWNLKHLSKFFAIYPLSSESMGNNILYNITAMDVFAKYSFIPVFGPPSFSAVMNEANKNNLDDSYGIHKKSPTSRFHLWIGEY